MRDIRLNLEYRQAEEKDLYALVDMLADDELGAKREDASLPLNEAYFSAFSAIKSDPNNALMVVESENCIVGMLQLTFIPYLTHIGSWRCLIEGVRIHKKYRGQGLGTRFFNWAIKHAKQRQCSIIQLTSDKNRPDAVRFYESLGFYASHEGLKMNLVKR